MDKYSLIQGDFIYTQNSFQLKLFLYLNKMFYYKILEFTLLNNTINTLRNSRLFFYNIIYCHQRELQFY